MFNLCLFGPQGSTSSSLCEHWIGRLMGSRPPSQASSGSSRRTSLASLSESAEFAGERSEDDGDVDSSGSQLPQVPNILVNNLTLMLVFLPTQACRAGRQCGACRDRRSPRDLPSPARWCSAKTAANHPGPTLLSSSCGPTLHRASPWNPTPRPRRWR